MSIPSLRALEKAFPGKGKTLRRLLVSIDAVYDHPAVKAYVRICWNAPANFEQRLCAIDAELGTYGVEYQRRGRGARSPAFWYCNTGDSYGQTIIRTGRNKYHIGDWGSLVERGNYGE